jgi:hypothetical protein
MANFSIDKSRLLHLLLLLGLSYAGGKLLLYVFEDWSPTAAYGFAITVVCQVSNAVLKLTTEEAEPIANDEKEGQLSRQGTHAANKKKKRK